MEQNPAAVVSEAWSPNTQQVSIKEHGTNSRATDETVDVRGYECRIDGQ